MSDETQTGQSVLELLRRLTENVGACLVGFRARKHAPQTRVRVKDRDDLTDCSSGPGPPAVSVIVPVHSGGAALLRCLDAVARLSPAPLEVIVVEDGDSAAEATHYAPEVQVVRLPVRRGPAAARNRGASMARGDILLFVDADVLVPATAVATVQACLTDPALPAVIGSYDRAPAAPNFVSQFKNLAHRFVHQQANDHAVTFWGACGAIQAPGVSRAGRV